MEFELTRYRHVVRAIPFAVAGSCVLAWAVGLQDFVQRVPIPRALETGFDGVIVLTGGDGRVAAGFRLLEDHPDVRLLVSGVGAGVRAVDLVVPPAIVPRVDLGRAAADTVGNAVESRHWARQRGIARAVLVTSDVHLPRSLLLFRYLAPDLEVVPYPVPGPGGGSGSRSWAWYAAAATEYSKALAMRLLLVLGGPGTLAGGL